MKLLILALLPLILAVSSESENLNTNAKDQKTEDSAFLQKFLPPLHHDLNHRYAEHGQEYNEGLLRNEGSLRNAYDGYYDYNDDTVENYLLRNEDRQRNPLYNVANIWGYSRGGLGKLTSHSYNGDAYIWGYSRNNEGRLRNEDSYVRRGNEDRPRILGNKLQEDFLKIPLVPEHIGYVGRVDPRGRKHGEVFDFKLIGRQELGLDKRTSLPYGLRAPLTHSHLRVVGKHHLNHRDNHYNSSPGYGI